MFSKTPYKMRVSSSVFQVEKNFPSIFFQTRLGWLSIFIFKTKIATIKQKSYEKQYKVFRICLMLKNLQCGKSVDVPITRSYAFFSHKSMETIEFDQ